MPVTDAYWPADTSVALSGETVGALLRRLAATVPDRAAIVEAQPGEAPTTLTELAYGQLYDEAGWTARRLLGVARPGQRIGIWAPNGTDWVVAYYGCALAGLVVVPLNPALTDSEVTDQLQRSACAALFTVNEFRGSPLRDRAARIGGRPVFDLATCRTQVADAPSVTLPDVAPDAPLLVQFTSGTTGAPKGAVLTHRVAINVGLLAGALLELGDGPVWCNPLPLHHVGGSVCVLLTAAAHAGTVALMQGFEPGEALRLMAATGATVLGAVPTMLLALLDHPDLTVHDLGALRLVQVGGSTVAPALIRRAETALDVRIISAYGQSEAPSAAQTRLADLDEVKALTIGRPGLHREARIVRPGTDETVAFGVPGELLLRSPLTMTGYLEDPRQSAATLDHEGWLHTGDLCAMSSDGILTMSGRIRDVIIRGGENVYPNEVENVLLGHPAISDVAVVGVPDEHWGEQVGAVVRFTGVSPPPWEDLEHYARRSLAGFKVPRVWRAVTAFPTTASGKIQKFRLAESFADTNQPTSGNPYE